MRRDKKRRKGVLTGGRCSSPLTLSISFSDFFLVVNDISFSSVQPTIALVHCLGQKGRRPHEGKRKSSGWSLRQKRNCPGYRSGQFLSGFVRILFAYLHENRLLSARNDVRMIVILITRPVRETGTETCRSEITKPPVVPPRNPVTGRSASGRPGAQSAPTVWPRQPGRRNQTDFDRELREQSRPLFVVRREYEKNKNRLHHRPLQ